VNELSAETMTLEDVALKLGIPTTSLLSIVKSKGLKPRGGSSRIKVSHLPTLRRWVEEWKRKRQTQGRASAAPYIFPTFTDPSPNPDDGPSFC
jgi:hypothetical protein